MASNGPRGFTFDDHELVNDIWGAGSTGRRNRRAVFRDIGQGHGLITLAGQIQQLSHTQFTTGRQR